MSDLFISDEEADSKLNNSNNGVKFHVIGGGKGPSKNFNRVESPAVRAIIGAYAKATSANKAAELFGTSQTTALKAGRGEINNGIVVPEIKEAVEHRMINTKSKALSLVDKALGLADDDEQLSDLTPLQLVNMAATASGVIKNLTKEDINLNMGRVTFNVVPVRTEEDYDEVDAIVVQSNVGNSEDR